MAPASGRGRVYFEYRRAGATAFEVAPLIKPTRLLMSSDLFYHFILPMIYNYYIVLTDGDFLGCPQLEPRRRKPARTCQSPAAVGTINGPNCLRAAVLRALTILACVRM